MNRQLILASLLLAFGFSVMAAPINNIEVRLTQPDGQVVNCFASGDEFYNYLHDANGFTIVKGDNGYYYYATRDAQGNVVPSAFVAGTVDPAAVGLEPYVKISVEEYYARRQERTKHIGHDATRTTVFANGRELNHGLYNNLVVFIRFAGDTYHTNHFSTVEAMFNADDYDANSLHNYYHHTSYNQLDLRSHFYPQPDGETILSYEDIYPKQYYQPYDPVTNPIGYQEGETAEREFSMLERAINYVESMVPDTIDFDYNDDGKVDNVVFVIKGEPGAWASLLWPHRWCIYDRYVPLHDLQVYDFNLQLEQGGYFTVSTLCHEMFHSLGAPDLYHYSGGIDPVGSWDLMCGTTEPPQQTSTYMKYKYGNWVEEIPMIDAPMPFTNEPYTFELEAVSWEGGRRNGFFLPTGHNNQYFFVEYRDKNNVFEQQIPGSGLLVYLIDTRFDGNASWNGNDYLDEVYLFRPGGTPDQAGNLDQAYFNEASGRTSFNAYTDPYPFIHQQPYTTFDWYNLTNIRKSGDRMCFDFLPYEGEGSGPLLEHFTVHVNSLEHQLEFSWDAQPNADYYKVYCDGLEISPNITDNTFVYPYTEADYGYHVYSVLYVSGGMLYLHSAPSYAWAILGNYETIDLDLACDSPFGTKGGELEVAFDNPAMPTQYLTLHEATHDHWQLQVPANTEVTLRWHAGFDPESQDIRMTASRRNGNGQTTVFDLEQPEEGILATFTVQDEALGFMPPQNLTATPEDGGIRLRWTMSVENHDFNIYRDGIRIQTATEGYTFLDDRLARSGSHGYAVTDANDEVWAWDPETSVMATAMTFSCEPPQNLQGYHNEGSQPYDELTWEAPEFVGHGMLAYDNDRYVDQLGSRSQKFGIKILPEHLAWFEGLPLTHLEMFDCSAGTYNFLVYNGETPGNDQLLYSQTHEMSASHELVRFPLDEAVPFDASLPLWICVEPNNVDQPAPYCDYAGDPNSCMVKSGGQWRPITYYHQYLSWMLRAYTAAPDRDNDFTFNVYAGPEECEDYEMRVVLDGLTATTATHPNADNTRYNVTAVWNGKETGFSNTIYLGPSVKVEEYQENDAFAYCSDGNIRIDGDTENATLQVIDLMGRIVVTRRDHLHCIPTAGMAPGMYVLRLIDGEQVKTQKIVLH